MILAEERGNLCKGDANKPLILVVDDGLFLKTREQGDAEELFSLVDKNRGYLRPWLLWVDATVSVEDSRKYIDDCLMHLAQETKIDFGIWHEHSLVGSVGMFDVHAKNKSAEIGYWLGKEYVGEGLMAKCVERLIDYGFNQMALNRLRIRCATGNFSSARIPKRLGFVYEGTHRQALFLYDKFFDEEVYGLLCTD